VKCDYFKGATNIEFEFRIVLETNVGLIGIAEAWDRKAWL